MRHTEPGIVVTLSNEGLRRASADNDLLVEACKRHELLAHIGAWAGSIAFGVFIGWSAVQGLTQ